MFLGYIDDSGGFKQKNPTHQVLSTVLIHDKHFSNIEAAIGLCVEDVIPEEKFEDFEEFHACELYGGYGLFQDIEQQKRFSTIETLLVIIKDYKLPVVYGAVDLRRLQQQTYASADPTDIAFRMCIRGIDQVVGAEQFKDGVEFALLIAPRTGIQDRHAFMMTCTSGVQRTPSVSNSLICVVILLRNIWTTMRRRKIFIKSLKNR